MDVGAPAYGQLQKLKGQSLDTADAPHEKVNVTTHRDFVEIAAPLG